jgi:uncharacterized protein YoxC
MDNWVISLSIALVAVGFAVLVAFLCITLFSLRDTLKTSDKLLQETKSVVDDLKNKIHAFDPLIHMISSVGGAVERTVHQKQVEIEERESRKANMVQDVFEWAALGVSLWQKVRSKR